MSGLGTLLFIFIFGALIIGSFACQIYVASKVFKGGGIIRGIIRGTPTFIRGWKQANELGIKDIMIFWTALLTLTLLVVCGACGFFVVNGAPTGTQRYSDEELLNLPVVHRYVVAIKPIAQGSRIEAEAVEVQEFEYSLKQWSSLPDKDKDYVEDISEVVGKTATVNIKPGQGIKAEMVK